MRQTSNLGLALYDTTDKMNITGAENSLNHNMELIDEEFASVSSSIDALDIDGNAAEIEALKKRLNYRQTVDIQDTVAVKSTMTATQRAMNVSIPADTDYTITFTYDTAKLRDIRGVYALDENNKGSTLIWSPFSGSVYKMHTDKAITGFSFYVDSNDIVAETEITVSITYEYYNPNAFENRLINLSYRTHIEDSSDTIVSSGMDKKTNLLETDIREGTDYAITLTYDISKLSIVGLYSIQADGVIPMIQSSPEAYRVYRFTAQADIAGFGIYVESANVTEPTNLHMALSFDKINNSSVEKKQMDDALALTSLEAMVDCSYVLRQERCEISVSLNNDSGNTTYIFHKIADFALASTECVGIRIGGIENAEQNGVVYVRGYDTDGAKVYEVMPGGEKLKAGVRCMPPPACVRMDVLLYPSTSGGYTDSAAVFTDIEIWKSRDGRKPIFSDHLGVASPPAYYLRGSYLDDKISIIRSLMAQANGNYDAFIFCTDMHWRLNARNSPSLMRYIADRVNLPRLFVGGDLADGINIDVLRALRETYTGRIYHTTGNHEYMNYFEEDGVMVSREIGAGDVWAHVHGHMTDAVSGSRQRGYYYADNPTQQMRYIVLSVYEDGPAWKLEQDQLDWLQATLDSLPIGYHAVVFTHMFLDLNDSYEGFIPSFAQPIADICDSHANQVACILSGHAHQDAMCRTAAGIPAFVTTCDKYQPYTGEEEMLANRVAGTITEQAFDVVIIDKHNRIVSAVRIGCPARVVDDTSVEVREQTFAAEV